MFTLSVLSNDGFDELTKSEQATIRYHKIKLKKEERMSVNNLSRAAKQIGDFGEGMVTYDFIRKGYEVANVDHVGADLICSKKRENGEYDRYAVSVKTRWFKYGSKESKMYNLSNNDLEKLWFFANTFGLKAIFSFLVCLSDTRKMYLISFQVPEPNEETKKFELKKLPFSETKSGYSIKFSDKSIKELSNYYDVVSISSWENETIGEDIF